MHWCSSLYLCHVQACQHVRAHCAGRVYSADVFAGHPACSLQYLYAKAGEAGRRKGQHQKCTASGAWHDGSHPDAFDQRGDGRHFAGHTCDRVVPNNVHEAHDAHVSAGRHHDIGDQYVFYCSICGLLHQCACACDARG